MQFGDLELISLCDGSFRLDGGAMFGVVPKPLWERRAPADARNRIRLSMRPLLVRGDRTLVIDAGVGEKLDPKSVEIYAIDRTPTLGHGLAAAGLGETDVDLVLASHLHCASSIASHSSSLMPASNALSVNDARNSRM